MHPKLTSNWIDDVGSEFECSAVRHSPLSFLPMTHALACSGPNNEHTSLPIPEHWISWKGIKGGWNARSVFSSKHFYIITIHSTMQFFKSAIFFVVAFATVGLAAPQVGGSPDLTKRNCKPATSLCSQNSDCCNNICLTAFHVSEVNISIFFVALITASARSALRVMEFLATAYAYHPTGER